MARRTSQKPTAAELEILRVLWRRGPSTVREVFAELNQERPTGYTTVLKQLQIMTEKGHVLKDESVRPQIYRPRRTEGQTQRQLVRDLMDRVFSGSPEKLVLQALSMERLNPDDRERIRRMLDELEDRGEDAE